MKDGSIYVTVNHIYEINGGNDFRTGDLLVLKKNPGNPYDDEAVEVYNRHGIRCGMVANSTETVARGSCSAGRILDRMRDGQKARVRFIFGDSMIAELEDTEQENAG